MMEETKCKEHKRYTYAVSQHHSPCI